MADKKQLHFLSDSEVVFEPNFKVLVDLGGGYYDALMIKGKYKGIEKKGIEKSAHLNWFLDNSDSVYQQGDRVEVECKECSPLDRKLCGNCHDGYIIKTIKSITLKQAKDVIFSNSNLGTRWEIDKMTNQNRETWLCIAEIE